MAQESVAGLNDLNRALYSRLMENSDRLYLTQTMLNGVVCLRFAIGAQRTEDEHIDRAWELIKSSAGSVVHEFEHRV